MAKCFRDREYFASTQHNIEFTLLEWYRQHEDQHTMIEDCKNLLAFTANTVSSSSSTILYQHRQHSITQWRHTTVAQLFKEVAGMDLDGLDRWSDLIAIAKERGLGEHRDSREAFSALFAHYLDAEISQLSSGLVIKDYPSFQGSLAKPAPDRRYVERFEIYFAGLELANGYSELCDSLEMVARYREFIEWQKEQHQASYEMDLDFIEALGRIDRAGGVALGIDRLLMLMTNSKTIQEVILFPTSALFKNQ